MRGNGSRGTKCVQQNTYTGWAPSARLTRVSHRFGFEPPPEPIDGGAGVNAVPNIRAPPVPRMNASVPTGEEEQAHADRMAAIRRGLAPDLHVDRMGHLHGFGFVWRDRNATVALERERLDTARRRGHVAFAGGDARPASIGNHMEPEFSRTPGGTATEHDDRREPAPRPSAGVSLTRERPRGAPRQRVAAEDRLDLRPRVGTTRREYESLVKRRVGRISETGSPLLEGRVTKRALPGQSRQRCARGDRSRGVEAQIGDPSASHGAPPPPVDDAWPSRRPSLYATPTRGSRRIRPPPAAPIPHSLPSSRVR